MLSRLPAALLQGNRAASFQKKPHGRSFNPRAPGPGCRAQNPEPAAKWQLDNRPWVLGAWNPQTKCPESSMERRVRNCWREGGRE